MKQRLEAAPKKSLAQTARKNQDRIQTLIKILAVVAAVLGLMARFGNNDRA